MAMIIFVLVVVLVVVWPVKIAAGWAGAGRTGFGACLIAVIVAGVLQAVLQRFLGEQWLATIAIALLASPLAYMFVLDTTYLKGLVISIVQVIILVVAVAIAVALGFGVMSMGDAPPSTAI